MQKTYSAGENVASRCTKCRLVLDHTIVAMDGGRIARVKCRTCGSTHKFHDPVDAPPARKPRARNGDAPGPEEQWESVLAGAPGKPQPYRMVTKYRVGDIVDHERFGRGIVRKVYVNKCDVLFRDRERLMASGN